MVFERSWWHSRPCFRPWPCLGPNGQSVAGWPEAARVPCLRNLTIYDCPGVTAAGVDIITGTGIRGVTTKILKMIAPIIVPHRGRIYSTSAYHKGCSH